MRCLPLLVSFAIVLTPAWGTAGEVSGSLSGTTEWTTADSPYRVTGDITVELLSSLSIAPGVVVELGEGVTIDVKGELSARGTKAKPVLFTGAPEGDSMARWNTVRFDNASADAVFTNLDDYQSGSIMEWCVVEGASRGVTLAWAAPYFYQSTFRNNRTPFSAEIEGGAAIYMEPGSAPRVRECHFESNVADGFNYGGALYIDDSQPILQDNTFIDNSSIYGGAVSTNLMASPIVGNHFEGNAAIGSGYSKGGGLAQVSSVSAVMNNTFIKNSSVLDGGGVHVCVDCFPHATPFFFDNTISENTSENEDPAEGSAGLGAGYLRTVADNNIHGNLRNGEPSEFGWYHPLEEGMADWISTRSIASNWWGTTNLVEVANRITDGTDIDGVGTVSFEPILEEPVAGPTPRVTLTTRRLHYDEPGETMRVYLTVYNPGLEGQFELRILLSYDGGITVPYVTTIGLPYEHVRGAGHHFKMPENSVYFTTLLNPIYSGTGGNPGGEWRAALYDSQGALVGQVSEIRFDLVEEVAQ
jgi:hypothetical protein